MGSQETLESEIIKDREDAEREREKEAIKREGEKEKEKRRGANLMEVVVEM